jgi:hypothetical protein
MIDEMSSAILKVGLNFLQINVGNIFLSNLKEHWGKQCSLYLDCATSTEKVKALYNPIDNLKEHQDYYDSFDVITSSLDTSFTSIIYYDSVQSVLFTHFDPYGAFSYVGDFKAFPVVILLTVIYYMQ